ncbi:MAG: hypothetical protein LLG06_01580 [Desulfobacteraceae bacterium]|nr:hypothetical protein [Desulfobacteraceae bacterium]
MVWLEMVSIRMSGSAEMDKAFEICRQCLASVAGGELLRVVVYGSTRYSTDITIHFEWKSNPGPEGRSILGREVSTALSDLGLINHTGWVELEKYVAGAA